MYLLMIRTYVCLLLYAGSNNLEEVLGTLIEGAITFPDPMVCIKLSVYAEFI